VARRYPGLSFRDFLQLRIEVRCRKASSQAAVASEFPARRTADAGQYNVSKPALLMRFERCACQVAQNFFL
jgi:hypothetical protein